MFYPPLRADVPSLLTEHNLRTPRPDHDHTQAADRRAPPEPLRIVIPAREITLRPPPPIESVTAKRGSGSGGANQRNGKGKRVDKGKRKAESSREHSEDLESSDTALPKMSSIPLPPSMPGFGEAGPSTLQSMRPPTPSFDFIESDKEDDSMLRSPLGWRSAAVIPSIPVESGVVETAILASSRSLSVIPSSSPTTPVESDVEECAVAKMLLDDVFY